MLKDFFKVILKDNFFINVLALIVHGIIIGVLIIFPFVAFGDLIKNLFSSVNSRKRKIVYFLIWIVVMILWAIIAFY
ncbi:hypothetical protein DY052_06125 [Apilactobacillus timberlakei]|uniref:hypothetical protein n=1 Tax=Apilactobacillus timberlakei TaxID=2008380 RepID=UPI001128A8AD|nr:hypothetical protein [Apilactobacillus timberlakei]TPR15001.1 hypothetical protein DY052_06125 [Apilactobacillus timberlakei]